MNIVLPPPPVFFIKSISEQGYSLSTAIADLVDNSITAGATRIELLVDTNVKPLRLFIADNGSGMDGAELTANMRFPSADLDNPRAGHDLGRFGLGMKTGSFSQARRFTLVSSKDGIAYESRTWDVDYLKETGDWTLLVGSKSQTEGYLEDFRKISSNFHASAADFEVRTLVVWDNLYKLERLKKESEINDELEDLRSHIGLVFHRFIQDGRISIRLNNSLVDAFNPFPLSASGLQLVSESYWRTETDFIRFQGIILPKRAAEEAKSPPSMWVAPGRTLEEMQGIYVYRNDRLINYGGWFRSIPKASWLQFGRIMIDISSVNDSEFQLNVAKSSLKIPFGLRRAMADMVGYVAKQAAKEYRERIASDVIKSSTTHRGLSLIIKENTAVGPALRINYEFEILRQLEKELSDDHLNMVKIITKMLEKKLNEVWKGESGSASDIEEVGDEQKLLIVKLKRYYDQAGYSKEEVSTILLESFGVDPGNESFINTLT